MIKFMLIALMACTGATEETPAPAATEAPATDLTVTVEEAPADATAASTEAPAAVEATTESTETTETTSAK